MEDKSGKQFRFGQGALVAIDSICEMAVDTSRAPGGKSEYVGRTYSFYAPGRKGAFVPEPEKYAESAYGPLFI